MNSNYHMNVTIKSAEDGLGLRERKKLQAMRHVQLTALELFEAHGFDPVTIEDIAKVALVSAPTIYRYFGTKEGLVLWDEYDPLILQALREQLRSSSLGDAMREAIVRYMDGTVEASRLLRRMRLVESHAGLRAAVAANLRVLRSEMANVFVDSGACRDPLEAEVAAGATTTALEIAVEHWARAGGKWPLRRFLERSLRLLRRFAEKTVQERAGRKAGTHR